MPLAAGAATGDDFADAPVSALAVRRDDPFIHCGSNTQIRSM